MIDKLINWYKAERLKNKTFDRFIIILDLCIFNAVVFSIANEFIKPDLASALAMVLTSLFFLRDGNPSKDKLKQNTIQLYRIHS